MEWPTVDLYELSFTTVIIRTLLAIIIGGVVGLERGMKNKAAGFRTYILVCVGSASVMMTNQFIFEHFGTGDPTRMGAQVISGIGFLGAGTILTTHRSQVRGLTTAAGLWTSACIGLAAGIGFYLGAITGGITVLLILTLLERVKGMIQNRSLVFECYIIFDSIESFNQLLKDSLTNDMQILNIHAEASGTHPGHYVYNISFELSELRISEDVVNELMNREGILFAKEIAP